MKNSKPVYSYPEYNGWSSMKWRCYLVNHKAYKYYGGKGITVCDRWLEPRGKGFLNFLEDMGRRPTKKHSIDRLNNSKGYYKENCRWATKIEQRRNQSNNRYLTFNGRTQHLLEWSKELNIPKYTIRSRIDTLGWSVEKALLTPYTKIDPLKITFNGETKSIKDWSISTGIHAETIRSRIYINGWTIEKTLTTPKIHNGRKKRNT